MTLTTILHSVHISIYCALSLLKHLPNMNIKFIIIAIKKTKVDTSVKIPALWIYLFVLFNFLVIRELFASLPGEIVTTHHVNLSLMETCDDCGRQHFQLSMSSPSSFLCLLLLPLLAMWHCLNSFIKGLSWYLDVNKEKWRCEHRGRSELWRNYEVSSVNASCCCAVHCRKLAFFTERINYCHQSPVW